MGRPVVLHKMRSKGVVAHLHQVNPKVVVVHLLLHLVALLEVLLEALPEVLLEVLLVFLVLHHLVALHLWQQAPLLALSPEVQQDQQCLLVLAYLDPPLDHQEELVLIDRL